MNDSAEIGKIGERTARRYLETGGYTFVTANVRGRGGEIDLVMRHGGLTCFVEVKTRRVGNATGYASDIGGWKWRRMRRMIDAYVAAHDLDDWKCLLVTVTVLPGGKHANISVLEI